MSINYFEFIFVCLLFVCLLFVCFIWRLGPKGQLVYSYKSISKKSSSPLKVNKKSRQMKMMMTLAKEGAMNDVEGYFLRFKAGTYLQIPLQEWGAGNVYLLVFSR